MVRTQKFDLDTDATLGGNNASDYIAPSQKAIKDYVDNHSGGAPAWGNITGTLSNQTDLQNALNNKVNGVVDANGIIIGTDSTATYGVVVGNNSALGGALSGGVVVGNYSGASEDESIVVGESSTCLTTSSGIVIGTNSHLECSNGSGIVIGNDLSAMFENGEKKLIVGLGSEYELCDLSTGLIPDARISSNIARTSDIPSGGANTDLSNLTSTGNNLVNTALNTRDNSTRLKFWTGTKAQYDAISTKDSNTLYNITDDQDITLTLLQTIYPVGSVYLSTNATCPLASLFGTWTLVSSGKALWTGTGSNGGSTINAGLPNITGNLGVAIGESTAPSGAFYKDGKGKKQGRDYSVSGVGMDASLSNSIYGNSTTVQPPAYVVNVWRRTA